MGPGDVSFIMLKLGFNHSLFGNNYRNGFNKTDWSDIEIPSSISAPLSHLTSDDI
jgi:hypothetical protein